MRLRAVRAFAVPGLLALSACASGPQERIVRGEFSCESGQKLRVAFNLDAGNATVRIDRSKLAPVVLATQNPGAGRSYAAEGYSLVGVGDEVAWSAPGAPRTVCRESR